MLSHDRKFRYLLALKLRKTVEELECTMPWDEYIEWQTALQWKAKEEEKAIKKAKSQAKRRR